METARVHRRPWRRGDRVAAGRARATAGADAANRVLLPATADDAEFQARVGAFLQGLQQSGWSIGRNVKFVAVCRVFFALTCRQFDGKAQ
jgi:hypothetical protein